MLLVWGWIGCSSSHVLLWRLHRFSQQLKIPPQPKKPQFYFATIPLSHGMYNCPHVSTMAALTLGTLMISPYARLTRRVVYTEAVLRMHSLCALNACLDVPAVWQRASERPQTSPTRAHCAYQMYVWAYLLYGRG